MKTIIYSFQNDGILFQDYHFIHSDINKNKLLPLQKIKAINLRTFPCSILTTDNEVIFLNHQKQDNENLAQYAKVNSIPVSNQPDIWEMICRIYLDTDSSMDESDLNTLLRLDIDKKKISEIRKPIDNLFDFTTEWQYLGQWDILAAKQRKSFFYGWTGKKFYWWTMQIATSGQNNYR